MWNNIWRELTDTWMLARLQNKYQDRNNNRNVLIFDNNT